MSTPSILFLFEHTGLAALPFTQAGFITYAVDILNKGTNPWVSHYIQGDILTLETELIEIARTCQLVIGMPPCTDLTVAGARHFKTKFKHNPNFQQEAIYLARTAERIGNKAGVTWIIENPIGVMNTLWRKPDFIFSPNQYGQYLPEDDSHPLWPQYIAPRDSYTKKTCIWASPGFVMPEKKPVTPEYLGYAVNRQTAFLGGKSQKTKIIRSASPRGFFIALMMLLCKRSV